MKKLLLVSIGLLWATSLWAHSPLDATVPAKAAELDVAPTEIVLDFKGNIRLTRVTLIHETQETDLNLDSFKGFLSDFVISLPESGTGPYQIDWRGLGDDGHPMKGSFRFSVRD